MELREAIEEFTSGRAICILHNPKAASTILQAVADGTLIPADACLNVDDGVLYQAMNDGYGRYGDFKRDVLMALTIRSADEVRREALEQAAWSFDDDMTPQQAREAILALTDTPQPKQGE